MQCYHCGFQIEIKDKIGRQITCAKCGSFLHCCLNCRFYSIKAYHQCRESQAEWVNDKKAANFCEYFKSSEKESSATKSKDDDSRRKLDQLFNK
jgi:hypothetical protein